MNYTDSRKNDELEFARRKLFGPGFSLAVCAGISLVVLFASVIVNLAMVVSGATQNVFGPDSLDKETIILFRLVLAMLWGAVNILVLLGDTDVPGAERFALPCRLHPVGHPLPDAVLHPGDTDRHLGGWWRSATPG